MSSQIDGLLAVKGPRKNAGSAAGSWFGGREGSPCMDAVHRRGLLAFEPLSSRYSNPPVVESPMIGGRLNGG